jgi:hypothetical protein
MEESARFIRTIGMRPVFQGPKVSVYELRGGTHLILMRKGEASGGNAPFDLMVERAERAASRAVPRYHGPGIAHVALQR